VRSPALRHFALFLVGALAACTRGGDVPRGLVSVQWQGSVTGSAAVPGFAVFCPATGIAELVAVRGDTVFGVALFPRDSSRLVPGTYPVFTGATVDEPRPGALLALRWLDPAVLYSFQGSRGTVEIGEDGHGRLTGWIEGSLRGIERSDTLAVTGTFQRVPFVVASDTCAQTMKRNRQEGPG